jgi:anti-anti-sigma factor
LLLEDGMIDTPAAVDVRTVAGRFTLVLHGEFDVATVDVLDQALRGVGARRPALVTVDLRDAAFFGLTALDTVLAAHAELAARGCALELVNTTWSVGKMLAALNVQHLVSAGDPALLLGACAKEANVVAPTS